MNQDIHQPAFIKADASYKTERNRQAPRPPPPPPPPPAAGSARRGRGIFQL